MLLYPNCKINIGLRVISKRADGYHDLETIFYPVKGLSDILEVIPSKQFRFTQSGLVVDCPADDNLIIKVSRSVQVWVAAPATRHTWLSRSTSCLSWG